MMTINSVVQVAVLTCKGLKEARLSHDAQDGRRLDGGEWQRNGLPGGEEKPKVNV